MRTQRPLWAVMMVLVLFMALMALTAAFLPLAFAQATPPPLSPPPTQDYNVRSLIALFINTTGTLVVIQLLKTYVIPALSQSYPAMLPILAGLMGPLLAAIQTRLATALGYPIDLSMVVAIFSGAASVGVNQFVKHSTAPTSRLRKLIG